MKTSLLFLIAAVFAAPQALAQVETQVLQVTTNGPSIDPTDFFEFFLTTLDAPCAPTMTGCFGQTMFYVSGVINCGSLDAVGLAAAIGGAPVGPGLTITVVGNTITIDVDTAVTGTSLFGCINMIECPFPFGYGVGGSRNCDVNNICSGICGDEDLPPGSSGFNVSVLREVGNNYCISAPNSVGLGASISALGSTSVLDQNLCLVGSGVPDSLSLFFYAPTQSSLPFGNGFLCVSGSIQRFLPQTVTNNMVVLDVDFSMGSANAIIAAGAGSQNLNFQLWFRDPGGPGGTNFNTSNAVEISFQP